MAFLLADRRGLLTKAWRTRSLFSGVLIEVCLPEGFLFCGRRYFSDVAHPQQYSIATRDTVAPMNIEAPTKYPLSHDDRIVVLEIRLHNETPMLYRPALHGNWNALSLTRRALKYKFPTPKVPLTAVLPNRQIFLPDPILLKHILQFITHNHQIVWSYFNCSVLFQPPASNTTTTITTTTTTTPQPPGGGTDPSCPTTDPNRLCTTHGGYSRDPCDPRVFYQCIRYNGGFIAYRFECAAGLVFDPSLNVCNWP